MSTKKVKKEAPKSILKTTKEVAKKVNNIALKTTDEVISESLTIAQQWQGVTAKALKGGFRLLANQQEIFFDTLDTFKSQFTKGKKRAKKIFA